MKSIKVKIIASVVLCALLSALVCGGMSILNSRRVSDDTSRETMLLSTQNASAALDRLLGNVELSVGNLYSVALKHLDNLSEFKSSKAYVDNYTSEMADLLLEFAQNTDGVLTAYIRYNPEFTEPTSGLFYTRDSSDGAFTSITPTDFSMYEPDDLEHVGWYYIPVNNAAPTWMDPYLNSNINVYMVSYVIPIYIDGESIGIIGMDIEFNTFTDIVDKSHIFDTGYAYLADSDSRIVYHKDFEVGTSLADAGRGLAPAVSALSDDSKENTFVSYSYNGQKKEMCYTTLANGTRFVMTLPEKELVAQAKDNIISILLGALLALILSVLIGVILSFGITKPITQITGIVKNTTEFNFASDPANAKLYKRSDETGRMARFLHNMRSSLRKMVEDIRQTYHDLQNTTDNLSQTTELVNSMSLENSDATQELAAAMEQTSATMESVNSMLADIRERSKVIEIRSKEGQATSTESKQRADNLKTTTDEASSKTTVMYNDVSHKADAAMEQAKAVEKINQLTQAILEISSQTNLLALNASIEAARAGDAGRGFAVVAGEIGQLASQTSTTAENINSIISDVHEAVRNLSSCLHQSTEFLEHTVLKDYNSFKQVADQYTQDAAEFENDMTIISQEIESLLAAIVSISGSVDGVTTTVGEAAESVTSIAQKTLEVANAVQGNITLVENNTDNIKRMKNIVEMFNYEKKKQENAEA